jgi:hypothetical protein
MVENTPKNPTQLIAELEQMAVRSNEMCNRVNEIHDITGRLYDEEYLWYTDLQRIINQGRSALETGELMDTAEKLLATMDGAAGHSRGQLTIALEMMERVIKISEAANLPADALFKAVNSTKAALNASISTTAGTPAGIEAAALRAIYNYLPFSQRQAVVEVYHSQGADMCMIAGG